MMLALGPAGTWIARADAPVDSPGPPSADGVQPVIADTQSSSDDCGELGFDHGIAIAGNGQVSSGDLTVTVIGYNSSTGFADWSSTRPIHGVYVKGGPIGGNLFSYPAGDTRDQDLHTPENTGTGSYEVSHFAFCWNAVVLGPDVTIAKANDPVGVASTGDPIAYTLTVSNEGDATAVAIVVTDQLPVGVTFADATAGCSEAAGLVTCALDDINAGAGLDVAITVTVDEGFCGAFVNSAEVAASNENGQSDGNNSSNIVTNTVECGQPEPPDLQVSKRSGAAGILHDGDGFLYTITVTNVGDEIATGVELIDVLPAGALDVGFPPFPTFAGKACAVTSSVLPGGVPYAEVRCGPVSLGPGASASATVKVFVSGDVCGTITNVVDVAGADEPEANVGPDNHAEASDEIACVPRIRLLKGGPSLVHVGDVITYLFIVRNDGGIDLSNIDLTDPGCDTPPVLIDDGNGDDILAVNERWRFTCRRSVTAGDGETVHKRATASGDHEGGTVTDSDTHDVNVIHPRIDLEKSATPTAGRAGIVVVYTYVVANTGDTKLSDISVDDDIEGHIGDIASLAAGASAELTHEATLGPSPITSVGSVHGFDVLGGPRGTVRDEDTVTVAVVVARGGGDEAGGNPFTGSEGALLAGWSFVLMALGTALLTASRRRPPAT
jgi:uncharacterized repeat protein (TIGR01451 family)